jgi:hypothetical protein
MFLAMTTATRMAPVGLGVQGMRPKEGSDLSYLGRGTEGEKLDLGR